MNKKITILLSFLFFLTPPLVAMDIITTGGHRTNTPVEFQNDDMPSSSGKLFELEVQRSVRRSQKQKSRAIPHDIEGPVESPDVGKSFLEGLEDFTQEPLHAAQQVSQVFTWKIEEKQKDIENSIEKGRQIKKELATVGEFISVPLGQISFPNLTKNPRGEIMRAFELQEPPEKTSFAFPWSFKPMKNPVPVDLSLLTTPIKNNSYLQEVEDPVTKSAGEKNRRRVLDRTFYQDTDGTMYIAGGLKVIDGVPTFLPSQQLQNLTELKLPHNGLSQFPFETVLSHNPGLTTIDLSNNRLRVIAQSRVLTKLNVQNNEIFDVDARPLKWPADQSKDFVIEMQGNRLSPAMQEKIKQHLTLSTPEKGYLALRPIVVRGAIAFVATFVACKASQCVQHAAVEKMVSPLVEKHGPAIYNTLAKGMVSGGVSLFSLVPIDRKIKYFAQSILENSLHGVIDSTKELPLQKQIQYTITNRLASHVTDTSNPLELMGRWKKSGIRLHDVKNSFLVNTFADPSNTLLSYLPSNEQELRNAEVAYCMGVNAVTAVVGLVLQAGLGGLLNMSGYGYTTKPYKSVQIRMENQQVPGDKFDSIYTNGQAAEDI